MGPFEEEEEGTGTASEGTTGHPRTISRAVLCHEYDSPVSWFSSTSLDVKYLDVGHGWIRKQKTDSDDCVFVETLQKNVHRYAEIFYFGQSEKNVNPLYVQGMAFG